MVRIFQIQGFRIPDRREAGEKKMVIIESTAKRGVDQLLSIAK